jgi:hypothetical protein
VLIGLLSEEGARGVPMIVLKRIERKLENMNAMLIRIGIEPDSFRIEELDCVFKSSLQTCQSCPNSDICSRWLEHAPSHIDRVPEFCPNGPRFERTKLMMNGDGLSH